MAGKFDFHNPFLGAGSCRPRSPEQNMDSHLILNLSHLSLPFLIEKVDAIPLRETPAMFRNCLLFTVNIHQVCSLGALQRRLGRPVE